MVKSTKIRQERIIITAVVGSVLVCNLFLLKQWTSSDQASAPTVLQTAATPGRHPSVDIISTGSIHLPALQDAQQRTFGSHSSVRNFFRITEVNDTEANCHTDLTIEGVWDHLVPFCKTNKSYSTLNKLRSVFISKGELVKKESRATGWVCAQKRPIDGFRAALKHYSSRGLPDYLIFTDDDTYINMDNVVPHLLANYPMGIPYVVAGCLIRLRQNPSFSLPFGGFGYMLNRAALENFLRPVSCLNNLNDDDEFSRHVCERVKENRIGEEPLFKEGMSVADLMFEYTFDQPFVDHKKWNDVGFCLHSDTAMAYFINFYNIPVHSGLAGFENVEQDRIQSYLGSTWFRKSKQTKHLMQRGECNHKTAEACTVNSDLCHYVTPEKMDDLHQQQKQRRKEIL